MLSDRGLGGGEHADTDVNDQSDRRESLPQDAALRAIVEGVESETGEEFFASLVRHLTSALDVQYAFVSEITPDARPSGHWRFGAEAHSATT